MFYSGVIYFLIALAFVVPVGVLKLVEALFKLSEYSLTQWSMNFSINYGRNYIVMTSQRSK